MKTLSFIENGLRDGSWLDMGDSDPEKWIFQDLGSGPEIQTHDVYGSYESEAAAIANNLASILVEKFSAWVGADSEEMLENLETIKDHLSDDFAREDLDAISASAWAKAWVVFDDLV